MAVARSVVIIALVNAIFLIQRNEAVRSRDITRRNSGATAKVDHSGKFSVLSISTDMSLLSHAAAISGMEAATIKNMSVVSAIAIIRKSKHATAAFLTTLQERFGSNVSSEVASRHNLRNQKQPDGGVAAAQAAGAYGSGAQKALDKLNEMILEAIEKMDFEVVRCDGEERTNLAQLASIRADIIMFNGMAAGAATTMNKAKGDKTRFEQLLEDSKTEFATNKETCRVERIDIEAKLKIVTSDLAVMQTVVAMTDCGDAGTAPKAALYQCVDSTTNRTWTEMRTDGLKEAIAKVQDPKMRKVLETEAANMFMQQSPSKPSDFLPDVDPIAGATTKKYAVPTKCSLSTNPQCPKMREKFMDLAGEVLDSLNELKLMLFNLNLHCEQTLAIISAQIQNYDNVISETNEKLTQATKDWGTYSGQKSAKDVEEIDVSKEHMDTMTGCKVNIENLASEKCALKKIRGELLKMDSLPTSVTDCDVGEWMSDPCSVSCGGGLQSLSRSLTPGELGAGCPAGKAEQTCQEARCPVDCVMEEWSEWGSCTAMCGGGIKEKARGIIVPALTKEAVQCGETSISVPCNVGACSGDCLLADWTSWSTECSKPCGTGEQTRVKPLARAAFGNGQCPYFYDSSRYEVKTCNANTCPSTEEALTCSSKLDVVLVVDGSGSLGQDGWAASVKGAAALARSFVGDNVKLSTLLFSGPKWFLNVIYCMGMASAAGFNAEKFDPSMDCGIQWVTRFDENKTGEANAKAMESMEFPEGSTLTSMALAEASAELSHGREDAASIVIVLTDGVPLSKVDLSKQATKLKEKARVMFVPVGNKLMDDTVFRAWASRPWEQNIVRVKDTNELASSKVINEILLDFCHDLNNGNQSLADLILKDAPLPEVMR